MKVKENLNKVVLITGSAGFVGFHLSNYLIKNSWYVIGLDNFSNYLPLFKKVMPVEYKKVLMQNFEKKQEEERA